MHSTYYEIRQQSQLRWEDPKAKKVFMKARKAFKKLENATEDHKGLSESYIVAIQAGQIIIATSNTSFGASKKVAFWFQEFPSYF